MAHGLEARSPFMDHAVAEFAARLPVRMKVRGRRLRYAQVELAKRYLPPAVLKRKKQGFASALPYMLKDELDVLYRAFLSDTSLSREGILRQEAIDALVAEHRHGITDHGNRLWLLLNSEVWFRMSIVGETADEIAAEIQREAGTRGESSSPRPPEPASTLGRSDGSG